MKKYIKNSTDAKIKVVSAESEYTGGNIWNFTGKLTNGNYFVASDADGVFVELNEDPNIFIDSDEPYSSNIWDSDWMNDHMVKDYHSEEEIREFWSSLISWLIDNDGWNEYTVDDILIYLK